jgi:hypothetical protein
MATTLTDLRYTDVEHTNIDLVVQIDEYPPFTTPLPFHYIPTDLSPVTDYVRAALASGSYDIAPYVPPPEPPTVVVTTPPGKSSVITD